MRARSWKVGAVAVGAVLGLCLWASSAAAQAVPDSVGVALYRQHCRSCHGTKGVPPARMVTLYPKLETLADSALQARLPVDSIVAILRQGKGKDMKSFADRLSAAEMAAVAKFVKTFGSPAPAGP